MSPKLERQRCDQDELGCRRQRVHVIHKSWSFGLWNKVQKAPSELPGCVDMQEITSFQGSLLTGLSSGHAWRLIQARPTQTGLCLQFEVGPGRSALFSESVSLHCNLATLGPFIKMAAFFF